MKETTSRRNEGQWCKPNSAVCRLSCRPSPLSWPSRSLSTFMPPSPPSWPCRSDATAIKVEFPRTICSKLTPMRGAHQTKKTAAQRPGAELRGTLSLFGGQGNAECMLTEKSTHSYSCTLHTPGRSVGVDGGHEKLIHVAAVQTCGSCEHVRLALCSAVRHCACSALYECMNV